MKMPSRDALAYAKLLGECILLAFVVPLVLFAVLRDPHRAVEHARIS